MIFNKILLKCCFLIYVLSLLSGCNSVSEIKYQSEIDQIASKLTTDKRESICNITASSENRDVITLRGETTIPQIKEELLNTLAKPGIRLIDSIIILPDTAHNKKYLGVVTLSVANLRKEPKHSAELVSQAILGTPVLVLKQENSWLLIQTPDNYVSWTERTSVQLKDKKEFNSWKKAEKVICIESAGWVYVSADESLVVGDLVSGAILEKKGESGRYISVRFPDGREGLVRKAATRDYLTWSNDTIIVADKLISIAYTFLGLPYLWGGTSSKAVDCSGFIQSVYFRNGVILSRDASLQAEHGIIVDISMDYSKLERGDMLFFGSRDERGDHVTHVALYIGDTEFIHASYRVMVNSLDSTRSNFSSSRKNSLLSARRVIGSAEDHGIKYISNHGLY